MPASVVPRRGESRLCACWSSVTTMPREKKAAEATIRIAELTRNAQLRATAESMKLNLQAWRFPSIDVS